MNSTFALLLSSAIAFSSSAVACAENPGTKVKSEVETLRKEQAPDKLLARGKAFLEVGDYTRAEQYLAQAMDSGADRRTTLPLLLKACVAEQRYRVALDYAEPALKEHPEDSRLRFVVASLYASIGQTGVAREHLEVVARESPDNAEAQFALAVLLRDGGDLPSADVHFREYLRIRPNGPHAEEARGSLLKTVP